MTERFEETVLDGNRIMEAKVLWGGGKVMRRNSTAWSFFTAVMLTAVLFTAALPALPGFGMTSHAAVVWEEDGEDYRCYDREGEPVIDSWIRDNGGYYYIDGDGLMAADRLLEDGANTYYLGPDGAMVKKQWVFVTADLDYMNEWFYFNSSGRAYKDGKKKIGGNTYLFDGNGCMLSGWQKWGADGDLYYLGTEDEGHIHTGWQFLEPWWDEMDGVLRGKGVVLFSEGGRKGISGYQEADQRKQLLLR